MTETQRFLVLRRRIRKRVYYLGWARIPPVYAVLAVLAAQTNRNAGLADRTAELAVRAAELSDDYEKRFYVN